MNSSEDSYRQLARKLDATCISHKLGNKSIDYTLKTYVKEGQDIGEAWIELAKKPTKLWKGAQCK